MDRAFRRTMINLLGFTDGCVYFFFFCTPPTGTPVALIRLARVGSTPIVTPTVMPGFRSATAALCPFTLISVNCVMINVRVVFSSLTVIVFPVTLEMTGAWYCAGVAFFFLLPAKAGLAVMRTRRNETTTNSARYIMFV